MNPTKIYTSANIFAEDENISVEYCKSGSCELHLHEFIELVYIMSGVGEHLIDGQSYKIKRGSMLFINYGQTHAFHGEQLEYVNLLIKPEFISEQIINSDNAFALLSLTAFEEFRSSVNKNKPLIVFQGAALMEIENIISVMLSEFKDKRIGYQSILHSYMIALLVHVFRKMSVTETDTAKHIAPDILEYLEQHFAEKISLDTLAKRSFYNPAYFSRLFKECYGVTLSEYIHRKRITAACRLLTQCDLPTDDICAMVGYSDKTLFYKHFKRIVGMTPSMYKTHTSKMYKSNTEK